MGQDPTDGADDQEKRYTEADLQREVRGMETACRKEAERALAELERRARSRIKELKADGKALRSRIAHLEGKSTGDRTYTQAELDAEVLKVEKRAYSEARATIEETEERWRAALDRWRRKAKDLGDKEAKEDEARATEEEKALEDASEFDLSKYRWSERVIKQVMKKFGLKDADALVKAAVAFDNGDRYLNKAELEEGAKALQA